MESREEKAIRVFRSGMSCAQSVVSAFAEDGFAGEEIVQRIAVGFGAGMGRLQQTCGAATGAFMAMGLLNSEKYAGNDDRKNATYSMIQSFEQKFKELNGTIICKDLMGCDLRTGEGQNYSGENNLSEKVCEKCVRDAVQITEELIGH